MSEAGITLHPGLVFYEVFLGALRVRGTDLKTWSGERGVIPENAKFAATGGWNGPKARDLREQMIETIGRDTFTLLYVQRMEIEEARDRAARKGAA